LRVLKKGKEVVRVALVVGGDAQAEETIDAYKRSEYDILVLSMGVGKFGHTLTNTNSVVYVDRTFDGDAFYQSFHRVERFGLDHPVQVVVLRCPGTIEEFNVEENLAGKMETVAHITEADLAKLLTSLGGKR
jgi:SNF2 family DNA or RNA helicase